MPETNNLGIVNHKWREGEFHEVFSSPRLPIQEDYAIVSLLRGLTPGRWIMLLAGTTTLGTQAAVEFACREDNVRELLQKAGHEKSPAPLEAVIHTEVRGGVPVRSNLVAVHSR